MDPLTPPRFALTFDDGPGPDTLPLLDVLSEADVTATFFICGEHVERSDGSLDEAGLEASLTVLRRGHTLGNHGFEHAAELTGAKCVADFKRCDELVRRLRTLAGLTPDALVPCRLPYGPRQGATDPRLIALAALGKGHVHWTSLFGDWELSSVAQARALADAMIGHTRSLAVQGMPAVLCLHDGAPVLERNPSTTRRATVEAVRLFLRHAAVQGWESFVVRG